MVNIQKENNQMEPTNGPRHSGVNVIWYTSGYLRGSSIDILFSKKRVRALSMVCRWSKTWREKSLRLISGRAPSGGLDSRKVQGTSGFYGWIVVISDDGRFKGLRAKLDGFVIWLGGRRFKVWVINSLSRSCMVMSSCSGWLHYYGKWDNHAPEKVNSRPEGPTLKGYILKTDFEHPKHFELANHFSFPTPKGNFIKALQLRKTHTKLVAHNVNQSLIKD